MFGIDEVHEYVLKLVDHETCPEMNESCPEADKLDITKCLSGMSSLSFLLVVRFQFKPRDFDILLISTITIELFI